MQYSGAQPLIATQSDTTPSLESVVKGDEVINSHGRYKQPEDVNRTTATIRPSLDDDVLGPFDHSIPARRR